MSGVRRRSAVLLAVAAAGLVLGPTSVGAQDGAPTVTLDLTGAKEGDTAQVRGAGWGGTELVYIELCGNAGRNGTRSCDQGHATLAGVGPEGTFAATLAVAKPPVPCPCVVKATSQTTQAFATAELAIQDVPVVPLENQSATSLLLRSVEITEAQLTGRGPWTSWLGAGAGRTLRFTVSNTGDVAVNDPPLSLTFGKGADPRGILPAPAIGALEPGDSVTIEVPVRFGAVSFGQHSAGIRISGFGEPVQAVATTSTYPWALIALGLIVVQLGLLRVRNSLRRRLDPHDDDAPTRELAAAPAALMAAGASSGHTDAATPTSTEEPAPIARHMRPDKAEDEDEADVLIDLVEAEQAGDTGADDLVSSVHDEAEDRSGESDPETSAAPQLPNPFDRVSAEQRRGAVERVSRVDGMLLELRREAAAQRAEAVAALLAAQAAAARVIADATAQADSIVSQAAADRSAATAELEQCRREIERHLTAARAAADAARSDAQLQRDATVRAAAAARATIEQMVANARIEIDRCLASTQAQAAERLDESDQVSSAPDEHRGPRPRGHLDSAIERAVHRAFQA